MCISNQIESYNFIFELNKSKLHSTSLKDY